MIKKVITLSIVICILIFGNGCSTNTPQKTTNISNDSKKAADLSINSKGISSLSDFQIDLYASIMNELMQDYGVCTNCDEEGLAYAELLNFDNDEALELYVIYSEIDDYSDKVFSYDNKNHDFIWIHEEVYDDYYEDDGEDDFLYPSPIYKRTYPAAPLPIHFKVGSDYKSIDHMDSYLVTEENKTFLVAIEHGFSEKGVYRQMKVHSLPKDYTLHENSLDFIPQIISVADDIYMPQDSEVNYWCMTDEYDGEEEIEDLFTDENCYCAWRYPIPINIEDYYQGDDILIEFKNNDYSQLDCVDVKAKNGTVAGEIISEYVKKIQKGGRKMIDSEPEKKAKWEINDVESLYSKLKKAQ